MKKNNELEIVLYIESFLRKQYKIQISYYNDYIVYAKCYIL